VAASALTVPGGDRRVARSLNELREILARGRRLSGQSSYDREAPARESLPDLFDAQTGLREYTDEHPDDEAGWRLRAQAEECVTNYTVAIRCLERAIDLSGRRDRKDLKVLARLREYADRK
jgi:hypothetical protein